MSINIRIKQLREEKKLQKNEFSSILKIDNSQYSKIEAGKLQPTLNFIMEISSIYNINPTWLLTGKGSMLLAEGVPLVSPPLGPKGEIRYPLVSPKAVAGFSNMSFRIEEQDIKEYYVVPKFKHEKIDFMIEVKGSSMYPKYSPGDIVACRIINEERYIQWNKTHLVASKDQGLLIKRIKKGPEGKLTLVSDNENYDPFEIPLDDIDGIALIVGVIRLE
jgi:repressor LexA